MTVKIRRVPRTHGAVQIFGESSAVAEEILRRRRACVAAVPPDVPFPEEADVRRSLLYVLEELRQGIYVLVLCGLPRMMVVFANAQYLRPFSIATDIRDYYQRKRAARPDVRPPRGGRFQVKDNAWWTSHGILCNETASADWGWSCTWVGEYESFIRKAIHSTSVEAEFLLNRRDLPMLPTDPSVSPLQWAHDPAAGPMRPSRHGTCVLPVLGLYGGGLWRDRLIPEPMPWAQFPRVAWKNKRTAAFFRGSATGAGVTPATNLRLALCTLDGTAGIDAGITHWGTRDKIQAGVVHFQPRLENLEKEPVPMHDWGKYRILLYCSGHSAALRFGPLLGFGSVVVWVRGAAESPAAAMWCTSRVETATAQDLRSISDSDLSHVAAAVVEAPVEDLVSTLQFLWAREDLAQRLGDNAARAFRALQGARDACLREALLPLPLPPEGVFA